MKEILATTILAFGLILFTSPSATAQSKFWVSPDGTFSVEVPVDLELADVDKTTNPGTVTSYVAKDGGKAFLVMVVEYPDIANKKLEDKYKGWLGVFGGYAAPRAFVQSRADVGPLNALKAIHKSKPQMGLLIDGGDTLYLLGFIGESKKDLHSPGIRKFFESFKLYK